jgi:hypothetical protein
MKKNIAVANARKAGTTTTSTPAFDGFGISRTKTITQMNAPATNAIPVNMCRALKPEPGAPSSPSTLRTPTAFNSGPVRTIATAKAACAHKGQEELEKDRSARKPTQTLSKIIDAVFLFSLTAWFRVTAFRLTVSLSDRPLVIRSQGISPVARGDG